MSSAERVLYADKAFASIQAIDKKSLNDLKCQEDYVQCLLILSNGLASEQKRKTEAGQVATLAVAEAQSLVAAFPDSLDFKFLLAGCFSAQGTQLLWWGEDNEKCIDAYRACLSKLEELTESDFVSTKILRKMGVPLNNICVALGRLNRKQEIPGFRKKQVEVYETLSSRFPEIIDYQSNLANALNSLAGLEQQSGRDAQAKELRKKAREILTATVRKFPDDRQANFLLIQSLTRLASAQTDATEFDNARKSLDEARTLIQNFLSAHPNDLEMYTLDFSTLRQLSVSQLQTGLHSLAAKSLQALVANAVKRQRMAESNEPTARELRDNYSFALASAAELFEYCAQSANRDPSLSSLQSTEVVFEYRKNRDLLRSQLQSCADQWLALIAKSDDPTSELLGLMDRPYLVTSRKKSLSYVLENSGFERQKAFLKAYCSFIELSERPPNDWPSLAILLASCSEYPVAPSTLVRFCKLALNETPYDVIAKQAYALALLRDGNAYECIKIIESDSVRDQRGSAWILALGYSHVGNKSKATELLQELERTMEANGEKLGSRSGKFNSKKQISNDTLDRIQWEAQGLLDMRQAEKQDLEASTE